MLDERKVKLMTKLALYEETHGKEDFKISSYYRKDYASLHVIYAFLSVSVGYVCLVGVLLLASVELINRSCFSNASASEQLGPEYPLENVPPRDD